MYFQKYGYFQALFICMFIGESTASLYKFNRKYSNIEPPKNATAIDVNLKGFYWKSFLYWTESIDRLPSSDLSIGILAKKNTLFMSCTTFKLKNSVPNIYTKIRKKKLSTSITYV